MTTEPTAAAAVDDIKPSGRLLLYDLDRAESDVVPLSDVRARTGLPKRTLRDALDELETRGLAQRRPDPRDGRRRAAELLVGDPDTQDDSDDVSIPRRPSEA